jgi:hypothetical protein
LGQFLWFTRYELFMSGFIILYLFKCVSVVEKSCENIDLLLYKVFNPIVLTTKDNFEKEVMKNGLRNHVSCM